MCRNAAFNSKSFKKYPSFNLCGKKKKLCFNKSDLVGNIQLIICKFTVILKNPYLGKKGTN